MPTTKMHQPVLLSVLLVLLPLGCSKENNVSSTNTGPAMELIPLKLGNSWVFKFTYYDTLGNVFFEPYDDTLLIIRDTLIQNEKWFFCQKWDLGWRLLTNRTDGVYARYPNGDDLIFKHPVALNSPYQIYGETRQLSSTNDTVKTIAGVFICYRYRLGPTNLYADWYLSPGVGVVKSERVLTLASGRQFTLYSYVLLEIHLN